MRNHFFKDNLNNEFFEDKFKEIDNKYNLEKLKFTN